MGVEAGCNEPTQVAACPRTVVLIPSIRRWRASSFYSGTMGGYYSALTPRPFTPDPRPQTPNPKSQTLNPQPSTLNPQPCTRYYSEVRLNGHGLLFQPSDPDQWVQVDTSSLTSLLTSDDTRETHSFFFVC